MTRTERNLPETRLRLAVIGLGRAGGEIARFLLEQPDVRLTGAFCSTGSPKAGKDLGELLNMRDTGILIKGEDMLREEMRRSRPDAVIDFSTPEGTLRHAEVLCPMRIRMVVGTTGFSDIALKRLRVLVRRHENGVVNAPNITTGVNVMMLLARLAAGLLNGYDFQITEMHHSRKKDAPSGTARKIAHEVERGLMDAGIGDPTGRAPIQAVRAGGIIGVHEVLVVGEQDQIRITHESFSRRIFAEGALKAARYVAYRSGWFEMRDTLQFDAMLDACRSVPSGKSSHSEPVMLKVQ